MKSILFFIANRFFGIFYDRKYLTGRFFEQSKGGYLWAARGLLWQKIFGFNRKAKFPVSHLVAISNPRNLKFHPDNLDNFQTSGIYFQNQSALIEIGQGTFIAPNVGLITQNHVIGNLEESTEGSPIKIGRHCWLGMNSVVLPGINLGDHTIVGAGAIVTKSFPEGRVVLVGNPARPIRRIEFPEVAV